MAVDLTRSSMSSATTVVALRALEAAAAGKLSHLFGTNDGNLQDYKLIKTHRAAFSQQFVFPRPAQSNPLESKNVRAVCDT